MTLLELGSQESTMDVSVSYNSASLGAQTAVPAQRGPSSTNGATSNDALNNKVRNHKELGQSAPPLQAKAAPATEKTDEVRKLQPITITQTSSPATRAFLDVSNNRRDFKLVDLYV